MTMLLCSCDKKSVNFPSSATIAFLVFVTYQKKAVPNICSEKMKLWYISGIKMLWCLGWTYSCHKHLGHKFVSSLCLLLRVTFGKESRWWWWYRQHFPCDSITPSLRYILQNDAFKAYIFYLLIEIIGWSWILINFYVINDKIWNIKILVPLYSSVVLWFQMMENVGLGLKTAKVFVCIPNHWNW